MTFLKKLLLLVIVELEKAIFSLDIVKESSLIII